MCGYALPSSEKTAKMLNTTATNYASSFEFWNSCFIIYLTFDD